MNFIPSIKFYRIKTKIPLIAADNGKYIELGKLSASLIHEISNPLSAALLHLEQASDQASNSIRNTKHSLIYLKRYVEAARNQINGHSQASLFSLSAEVMEVKRILLPFARSVNVNLKIFSTPNIRLYGDPIKFQQILANVISNAVEAYEYNLQYDKAKVVEVKMEVIKKTLNIMVHDNGKGISAHQLSTMFKPFYSDKNNNYEGLGLGLAIVNQYVTQYFHGRIKVYSDPKKGTLFIIKIPLSTKTIDD